MSKTYLRSRSFDLTGIYAYCPATTEMVVITPVKPKRERTDLNMARPLSSILGAIALVQRPA